MTEKTHFCTQCGDEGICYEHEGKYYCGVCAHGLLAKMKHEYAMATDVALGWKIEDLWRQIVFDPRSPEYDESRLEDANWLEETEDEALEDKAMLALAREEARKLVRDFVKERLHGDLSRLRDFNFITLKNDVKYGQDKGQYFDADDCLLSRAIYVLVWGDVFPCMSMPSIGNGRAYRGDTMNTFHTMFGRETSGQPGYYLGLESFHPDDETRCLARAFHEVVPTIGNCIVLPNHADRNGKTLNTYRGSHFKWRDYFGQFLAALKDVLLDAPQQDAGLHALVKEHNHHAFGKYTGLDGFHNLAKQFFLDAYLDENGHDLTINSVISGKIIYHWMKPRPSDDEYLKEARSYARNAMRIIHSRSQRIVDALAKEL